jgi:hypothetical protein
MSLEITGDGIIKLAGNTVIQMDSTSGITFGNTQIGESGITFPNGDTQTGLVANVAQTLGVPTGGIMESGSNANGTYIKFPDGTMICNMQVIESRSVTGVVTTSITFPATFAAVTVPPWNNAGAYATVIATPISTVPQTVTQVTVSGISTTSCTMYVNRSSSTATAVALIAYGRWY